MFVQGGFLRQSLPKKKLNWADWAERVFRDSSIMLMPGGQILQRSCTNFQNLKWHPHDCLVLQPCMQLIGHDMQLSVGFG